MAVVVLGVLVASCAVMLIPPMWAAVVDLWQYRPPRQQCRVLKDAMARQACCERLNGQTLKEPLIGTEVPVIATPSGAQSN